MVVFLGPTLPASEAKRLARCQVRPPARKGDVWRATASAPSVIVLIDGVFDQDPSVWHRELVDALDSGIAVFGASSMGALRAAELHGEGMVGIGTIYRWYADEEVLDDAYVALLHGTADYGFRPLTVPHVNVRHLAAVARRKRLLTAREAAFLEAASAATHYQARDWPALWSAVEGHWAPKTLARFRDWVRNSAPDLKAEDARACLTAAEAFRRGAREPARRPAAPLPSMARREKLWAVAPETLRKLQARPDAAQVTEAGLARMVLAWSAREAGLGEGADLEKIWLEHSRWVVSDGPDPLEALALEAGRTT